MLPLLLLLGPVTVTASVTDLSGEGWTLTSPNDPSISVRAKVPSQNYVDLIAGGVIPDPLYGLQEDQQSWVRHYNWTYTSPVIDGLHDGQQIQLVFDGLDTFTTISFCDQIVATTNNQFRQWIVNVTDAAAGCEMPRLELNFGAAVNITHEISHIGDPNVTFANSCEDDKELSCKVWARKEQSDFGWDWSPHLVPAGPWRGISLVQLDPIYIHNAAIDIYRQGQMNNLPPDQSQPWVFNASLDYIGRLDDAGLHLDLWDNDTLITSVSLDNIVDNGNTITGDTIIDPSTVQLWWPNEMGAQQLYRSVVSITPPQTKRWESTVPSIAQVERRVGFRTIVLNLEPVSEADQSLGIAPGSNWHFEINGLPFYAKGSNLVPVDVFWSRANYSTVDHLFELCVDSHFNMLRVWSSGAYLDDWVYDMADEMGLLLWSEFEFTDAPYSAEPQWETQYEAEAYYNTRRVNHHPSLALWAGGNELEAVMLAFFATGPIFLDYQETFEKTLIKCVYANSRSISYIPSSTYNGYTSLDFDSIRPQAARYKETAGPEYIYANSDYYNGDGTQAFNDSAYPVARLANEFGCISMPSIESWRDIGNATSFNDPVVLYHNRHVIGIPNATVTEQSAAGIEEMTLAAALWYPTPDIADPVANFSAWIWTTQVFQADYYASQIAFYRRGSGLPERQLGALYWQLNDVWTAPTWSSVGSNLKPKVLQSVVKDIFKPVIVRAHAGTELEVWVTSDRQEPIDATVDLQWMQWSGTMVQGDSVDVHVGALNSTRVNSEILKGNHSDLVLQLHVHGDDFDHCSYHHPTPLARSRLQDPGLVLTDKGTSFVVEATSAVAAWVTLDHSAHKVQGYWSDNGFWLNKGERRKVDFTVWNDWTEDESWRESVSVRSMWDNLR